MDPAQTLSRSLSVQFSRSVMFDSLQPHDYSTPGFPVHHQLPELTETHVHWVGDAIQPSHPVIPFLLPPSIFSSIKVFSGESVLCIRWPKYWSFSFSISLSNAYSGLMSFSIDWFDLEVQGTLKSLLQHHSSKHQFLSAQFTLEFQLSKKKKIEFNSHIHKWLLEKP